MLKTFYIGVKGVIVSDDRALLLKRRDQGGRNYWDIPGGRVDDDEKFKQTLERELKEELPSIQDIQIGNLLYVYRLSHDLKDGNGLVLVFFKVKAFIPEVVMSNEHFDYNWIGLEELDKVGNDGKDGYLEEGYREAVRLALSK